MKSQMWRTILVGCLTAMLPIWAAAAPIGQGAFGPGATTEGFENFVSGPSVVRILGVGDTFASGVQYQGIAVSGVVDLSFGDVGCFGSPVSAAQVPEGTAFICGNTGLTAAQDVPYKFLLPANTIRVGGLTAVTGTALGPVFMRVYDASNTLLETVSYTDISGIGNWGTNFLGIEQLGGIARVEFVAGPSVGLLLDALVFETTAPPDDDNDGVPNDLDLCPATAAAAAVDSAGCSDAQVDGDGDGVCTPGAPSGGPSACTGIDNCPVDANPGQEDFDMDGEGDACDDDVDGDSVVNDDDFCPDTSIPEGIPTQTLLVNRWALTDGDGTFDTVVRGRGPGPRPDGYSIEDTAGCSCEQILAAQGLEFAKGHTMFGCSISVMDDWVELVTP